MLHPARNATDQRRDLREALKREPMLRFPGAFSPLVAMLIEQMGFEGVYVSGAVISANLGLPDIGLTSVTEVVQFATDVCRVSRLPAMVDIDTGFGEPVNVARTVQLVEAAGVAAFHLEDQTLPKRCGHLDHKELIEPEAMARKIKAAVDARVDANLIVVARTDARGVEGLECAIDRAKRYVDAGADMVFPEALVDEREFGDFRQAINVPLVANMTEFGKSPLLNHVQLQQLGYDMVIYPVTTLRWAMHAAENGLRQLLQEGTQQETLDHMQSRRRLYELLQYDAYAKWDQDIVSFREKE